MAQPNCSALGPAVDASVGTILLLECGCSILGNSVALGTLCFRLKVWKPYAIYLLHLALADLLLAACLPFHAAFYLHHRTWDLGHRACQVLVFLQALGRGVGVAFLTAVALDRYLRVVHPRLRVNLLSSRGAQAVSGLVWPLMAVLSHQTVLVPEAECPVLQPWGGANFSLVWRQTVLALQFLLPCGLIVFCNVGLLRALHARLRDPSGQPRLQRARALVVAVVLLFGLCFLPSFLVHVVAAAVPGSAGCKVWLALAWDLSGSLTYLQSALNPVIYCFSNPAFKHSYRRVLYTLRGRRPDAAPPGDLPEHSDS